MTIRGSSIQSGNDSSYTLSFPTGTVAGDLAVVFAGIQTVTAPAGWTREHNASSSSLMFMQTYWKILDSSDIGAGSATFTIGSTEHFVAAIVTVANAAVRAGAGDVTCTWFNTNPLTLTTTSAPEILDGALYFGACSANLTETCDRGSVLQTASTSTGSGVLTTDTLLSPGSVTASFIAASGGVGGAIIILKPVSSGDVPLDIGPDWLIIREPGGDYTNRTKYLSEVHPSTFTLTRGERGTANIVLNVKASDDYAPTEGTQALLYEQTESGFSRVFAGTIDTLKETFLHDQGDREYELSCVSFEQLFDTFFLDPAVYTAGTSCGAVFTAILAGITGLPVTAGTIDAGYTLIDNLIVSGKRPSEVFEELAKLSGFIWYVDPSDLTINFHASDAATAPFTLQASHILWGSIEYEQKRDNYRNRQILKGSADAFPPSAELFRGTGSALFFTLRNYPEDVTAAWVTHNTQNTATGTFSGVPNDGDTITIGYPASGSIYDWAATAPYATGQIILDRAGNIQKATTGGTSGSSYPAFNEALGATTTDGTVIWTCQGPSGGDFAGTVYTWKDTIDNREWGQILIGASAAACAQNLVDAVNSTDAKRGVTFSLPTWENAICNADTPSGGTFTIRNKHAGQGYIAALSESCTNFAWSAALTSGGSTTFNTYSLSTAVEGTSNTANLYWQKGSKSVKLVSSPSGGPTAPISSSWYLQVEYRRVGSGVVAVEDTDAVAARAALEGSTGKYHVLNDDSENTSAALLLKEAKAGLELYGIIPASFKFGTDRAGLLPGKKLTISLSGGPVGASTLIDGDWLVQEVQGDIIPGVEFLRADGGHFRYTVTVINAAVIANDIELWQKFAGAFSGGGSGGGGAIGPVSLAGGTALASPLTTKGDLLGYDTASNRIPVGTDGQVLTADSSQLLGVKWAAAATSETAASETPSGTLNGSNKTFTLAHTPIAGTLALFLNGIQQVEGQDFTLSTATITMTTAPKASDTGWFNAEYRY